MSFAQPSRKSPRPASGQAVNTVFGSIPSFVTVNLMVMDYGGPSQFVCFVANGTCDMGRSAILAGVHFWSYDRDIDCPPGPASPVCNSLGGAGAHGFLRRFQGAGL